MSTTTDDDLSTKRLGNVTERPNGYDRTLAEEVLTRICQGEMLLDICKDRRMPTQGQFYGWVTRHPELREAYARARELWADHWAEMVIQVSFDDGGDFFIEKDRKGREVVVADHAKVQRDRLKVDSIKWLVGKYAPRRFGEKPEALPPEPTDESRLPVTKIKRIIVYPKQLDQNDPT